MRSSAVDQGTARFGQAGSAKAFHVIQGDQKITSDPDAVLTTILGSCVAACLRDPVAGIGGMNHFLLPGEEADRASGAAERQGVHAMELLVNALLQQGAVRSRLEAKLFGGARTMGRLTDVGSLNAEFASNFLRRERITVVGECLRGFQGRRVQYWPISGRARRIFLAPSDLPAQQPAPRPATPPPDTGTLDLF